MAPVKTLTCASEEFRFLLQQKQQQLQSSGLEKSHDMELSNDQLTRLIYLEDPHNESTPLDNFGSVHLIDSPRRPLPLITSALDKDHPIISSWDEVCGKIIEMLGKANIRWVTVGCFKRGIMSASPGFTTVLIATPNIPIETDGVRGVLHEIHEVSGMVFYIR